MAVIFGFCAQVFRLAIPGAGERIEKRVRPPAGFIPEGRTHFAFCGLSSSMQPSAAGARTPTSGEALLHEMWGLNSD